MRNISRGEEITQCYLGPPGMTDIPIEARKKLSIDKCHFESQCTACVPATVAPIARPANLPASDLISEKLIASLIAMTVVDEKNEERVAAADGWVASVNERIENDIEIWVLFFLGVADTEASTTWIGHQFCKAAGDHIIRRHRNWLKISGFESVNNIVKLGEHTITLYLNSVQQSVYQTLSLRTAWPEISIDLVRCSASTIARCCRFWKRVVMRLSQTNTASIGSTIFLRQWYSCWSWTSKRKNEAFKTKASEVDARMTSLMQQLILEEWF